MARHVTAATFEVYQPGNQGTAAGAADSTIASDDVLLLDVDARAQSSKDIAHLEVDNRTGTYTDVLRAGSAIRFLAQFDGDASQSHVWTGMVDHVTYDAPHSRKQVLKLDLTDWVYGILDNRIVVDAFEATAISGSASAILNNILSENASEIDRASIDAFTETVDAFYVGTPLLDAVTDLRKTAKAAMYASDWAFAFTKASDIAASFGLSDTDKAGHKVEENSDDLVNAVRIDGGESHAVGDSQTTQDAYSTVTSSTRLTHQLSHRKSEIDRIELWTRDTGSNEDIIVRLQKDDAGAPIDVNSKESDIARKRLDSSFLSADDYTTFILPDHTLPEPNPWFIVETDGSTGQDIGIDSTTSEPTYKVHYPYPLATNASDQSSINTYGKREVLHRDDNLRTREATNTAARSTVETQAEPRRSITFVAESDRAHGLTVGDAIDVDYADENAVGTFVVTRTVTRYQNHEVDMTVQATDAGTVV